ncbi:MAG: protein translocase subunit SecD [Deltaproteobacteria bacterium]
MNPGTANYRLAAMLAMTLGSLIYLSPVFLPAGVHLPLAPAESPIKLGLDLRGGTHLLFAVEVEKAVVNSVGRTGEELSRAARDEGLAVAKVGHEGTNLTIQLEDAKQRPEFEEFLTNRYPSLQIQSGTGATVQLALSAREIDRIERFAMDQSLETIRNRVDQFGVAEPTIQRQGDRDIVVQLPGVQDPQRAKGLIGRTAVLEFRLVADGDSEASEELKGSAGSATVGGSVPTWQVEKKVLLSGGQVADARVRPATQLEGPYVELVLTDTGSDDFEALTEENVGRNLAIVLDGRVFSAPNIRERIGGGRASITGNFDMKEAHDLAIVLRAGALPAPIRIIEERTVGPSLGRDSIEQGVLSLLVGGVLVVLFMMFYYRGAGVLADVALGLNVIFLMTALAAFGMTLTLPGIAGIVLTMGMAVDANVLINERVREELLLGKTPRAAVETGYERAWAAIRDSNITTFVSGLILFQFGSGPVKGFALTLCVGILTTVLTAVFGTRIYYDFQLSRRGLSRISI